MAETRNKRRQLGAEGDYPVSVVRQRKAALRLTNRNQRSPVEF